MTTDHTTRGMASRFAVLSAAVAAFYGQSVLAAALPSGALDLKDVNFTYPGASSSTTGVGLGAVNFSTFGSAGYVNVQIGGVWAIQNLPVDPSNVGLGVPGLSQYLNLPAGTGALTVLGDFSPTPSDVFPSGTAVAAVITKSATISVNAQGRNAVRTLVPGPQDGPIAFVANALTSAVGIQPGHGGPAQNIEQDVNQCAPASVANSLNYLKNRYGTAFPAGQTHIPGINGNPAGSLVGGIDQKMGRLQGQSVADPNIIDGKLKYLGDNNLAPLTTTFQGGVGVARANRTVSGRTATDAGAVPTTAYILSELARGEDVELFISWDKGGGHAVDLIGGGTILGVPWVAFQHDSLQGFNAANGLPSNNGGTGLTDGGYGFSFLTPRPDGFLGFRNFVDGTTGKVDFIMTESVPEPTAAAFLAFAGVAALARRRRT